MIIDYLINASHLNINMHKSSKRKRKALFDPLPQLCLDCVSQGLELFLLVF